MSDNVPFEIQVEIVTRLPVKSVIQFRSVCKTWKSLIDSSQFIARYSCKHTQPHLLVRYDEYLLKRKYVSIVDDASFPSQKVSLTIPRLVKRLTNYQIVGCSNGLLCLYGDCQEGPGSHSSGTSTVVLWNPSIRKAVDVIFPNVAGWLYETELGFGVCQETNDPKIIKITHIQRLYYMEGETSIPWQVEVFTLSTGAWRSLYSNLPRKSIYFDRYPLDVNGCVYWLATDRVSIGRSLIVSFDMTTEEFKDVDLPDRLACPSGYSLSMSKLRESLAVLECPKENNNPVICVWMMEGGVSKSFTKLFNVHVSSPKASVRGFSKISVRGFRKTGEPIVLEPADELCGKLVVYDPYTKHIDSLGIDGELFSFYVYPYMETLFLLDK